ncbi:hypothetical protein JCM10207_008616 [Rhodosporidiobolus poonsookiae]
MGIRSLLAPGVLRRRQPFHPVYRWEAAIDTNLLSYAYYGSLTNEQEKALGKELSSLYALAYKETNSNSSFAEKDRAKKDLADRLTREETAEQIRERLPASHALLSLGSVHSGLMRDRMAQIYGFDSAAHWAKQW